MKLYFVTVKFTENVHSQGLGFTKDKYFYIACSNSKSLLWLMMNYIASNYADSLIKYATKIKGISFRESVNHISRGMPNVQEHILTAKQNREASEFLMEVISRPAEFNLWRRLAIDYCPQKESKPVKSVYTFLRDERVYFPPDWTEAMLDSFLKIILITDPFFKGIENEVIVTYDDRKTTRTKN